MLQLCFGMHFFSVPSTIQRLFPACLWKKQTQENTIYLTFDDGPHPFITPWIMNLLKDYNAKATFFCVGDNVVQFPDVCEALIAAGHRIGNHTMQHVKGWRLNNEEYLSQVSACDLTLKPYLMRSDSMIAYGPGAEGQKLFRPPYGQIKPSQMRMLLQLGYRVVQWSDLSCDYDPKLRCESSLRALVKQARKGNIVVFHDSRKAENQLKWILPRYLEAMCGAGYTFATL